MSGSSLLSQYEEQKALYPDCVIFFRMGDFYEMYGEDAKQVSQELSITLGSRPVKGGERIPLCGVPSHTAGGHARTLAARGYRVAICEQHKDGGAKGGLKRSVVRVITPGSLLDSEDLESGRGSYIAACYLGADGAGFAAADISTGVLYTAECEGEERENSLLRELGCYAPKEALLSPEAATNRLWGFLRDRLFCSVRVCGAEQFDTAATAKLMEQAWPSQSTEALGLAGRPSALRAVGAILRYIKDNNISPNAPPLIPFVYERDQFLQLDPTARADLELTETLRKREKKGSLLGVLDLTVTAMGSRCLRSWLSKPLMSPASIGWRQDMVEELHKNTALREQIRSTLGALPDVERLLLRLVMGQSHSPKDLAALRNALSLLPDLRIAATRGKCRGLRELRDALDTLPDVYEALHGVLGDDDAGDGGLFRKGCNPKLDSGREEAEACHRALAELVRNERERIGAKSLKLGKHKQYGYYFELPKSRADKAPSDYEPRQSLSGHERYVSSDLRALEARLLSAEEDVNAAEAAMTEGLRLLISAETHRVQRTAQAAAALDALCSFAQAAFVYGYVRPLVDHSDCLEIVAGRHPTVERTIDTPFISNDTELTVNHSALVLTGPNMAGKSTFLRQNALIVLMAQAGSFVPAAEAHIGIVDRVFTRVGAADDLAGGSSTFMVEMREVADILRHATRHSLLILDEVGRGTSTYDGLSVARAVLEHIHTKIGARTLFATHYRELCELEQLFPGVRNYHLTAGKEQGDLVFSRHVRRGVAGGSLGIDVAALAGVPAEVTARAGEILSALEAGRASGNKEPSPTTPPVPGQRVSKAAEGVLGVLRGLDLNTMTPLEAMITLSKLREMAGGEEGESRPL